MFRNGIISFVLGLCLTALSGCGGQLYTVAPLPSVVPPDPSANVVDGFNVLATVIDGDQSLERFEANLPLAGVVAVDVQLINRTAAAINVNSLKFHLKDAGGQSLQEIEPKRALKQVMKYYGDGFYRLDARQRTIESYEAVTLPLILAIAPQEERRGILFFQIQRNTVKPSGLTLSVSGSKTPVNVKLN